MSIIIPSPFPKEFEKIQLSIRSTIPGIRDIKKFEKVEKLKEQLSFDIVKAKEEMYD